MVSRYDGSTSVPVAPVARPRQSLTAELAGAVHDVAGQALQFAQTKLEEQTKALESASLNQARIELEKRGTQLALDMQKDRIAGSDYVKDLEKARGKLKDDVWATMPGRVQKSTAARMTFDDIWTSDQLASSRTAATKRSRGSSG